MLFIQLTSFGGVPVLATRDIHSETKRFKRMVLPLSIVDKSVFSPSRLTILIDPVYPSL